jgi:photosystem II stability/assembly factor-like uncharacterized protein
MSSITPYNNYTVRDLSSNQQPYVNSTTEFGYFTGVSSNPNYGNNWYSLPTFLNTNNGVASVDASGGLHILSAGIYTINIGLDFFTSGTHSNTAVPVYFCLGNIYLNYVSLSGSFGGSHTTGMFSFGSNATTYPGIISWITNSISIGATSANNYLIANNELMYEYFTDTDGNGTFSQGICTTEIKFIINGPTTIYLNTKTASTLAMGKSYFTLQLISNIIPFTPIRSNSVSAGWTAIASDTTGQYVVATEQTTNSIYRSTDYGANWTQILSNIFVSLRSISSSSNGSIICAVSTTGSANVNYIAVSTNSGSSFSTPPVNPNPSFAPCISTTITNDNHIYVLSTTGRVYVSTPSSFYLSWSNNNTLPGITTNSIASSDDGTKMFIASNGSVYISTNNCSSAVALTGGLPSHNWTGIASDSAGVNLAVVAYAGGGIWTSTNSGSLWTQRINDSQNWDSIASSANGAVLVAGVNNQTTGTIYVSTNYGVNWKPYIVNGGVTAVSISDDGKKIAVAVYNSFIYYFYT